ncbi:MAG: butyryl-CoA:acetate CoA-transferase [Chloroflexi bacterium]|nr:butyryl-CoA:acetate CoA-transferase [Chloroflexota bacterium]
MEKSKADVMSYRQEYRRKLIPAAEAAGLVKSGMWVEYGQVTGFPLLIDEELAKRTGELERVKVRAFLPLTEPRILMADPRGAHFVYHSWHYGTFDRKYQDKGAAAHIPYNLEDMPRLYREFLKDRVDILFIEVTPMSQEGYFNFGAYMFASKAMCDVAKTVVVEVNESQPWVCGGSDEVIHISEVDYIVANSKYELAEFPVSATTKADERIAEHIVGLIEDGATIQLGTGGLPNAVGKQMIKHGLKDLGIHTGLFTESMMELIEAGVVTGKKKTLNPGKAVCGCAMGSKKLYRYVDRNDTLAFFSSTYTHDPQIIAQNNGQVAINNAIKVDLRGQVCAESAGYRQISATGGLLAFNRGAYMSPGGKAFICLYSTYKDNDGKLKSSIVLDLEAGDVVSVPRTEVSYIVTEHGVVNLKGMSSWQRAKLLISIAHPDFRAELEEAAMRIGLITRGAAGLEPLG